MRGVANRPEGRQSARFEARGSAFVVRSNARSHAMTEPAGNPLNQIGTPPRQPEETTHPRRSSLSPNDGGPAAPPHHHKGMDSRVEAAARQGDEPDASLFVQPMPVRGGTGVYWFAAIILLLAAMMIGLAMWAVLG
jgi:hypothetical protein